jgi:hypothetical protein
MVASLSARARPCQASRSPADRCPVHVAILNRKFESRFNQHDESGVKAQHDDPAQPSVNGENPDPTVVWWPR